MVGIGWLDVDELATPSHGRDARTRPELPAGKPRPLKHHRSSLVAYPPPPVAKHDSQAGNTQNGYKQ